METKEKKEAQYEKIVMIPTDFSEVCDNAIHHGVELAQYLHYNVCILHVINKETKSFLKKERLSNDFVDKKMLEYKNRYEKETGITVECRVGQGLDGHSQRQYHLGPPPSQRPRRHLPDEPPGHRRERARDLLLRRRHRSPRQDL